MPKTATFKTSASLANTIPAPLVIRGGMASV